MREYKNNEIKYLNCLDIKSNYYRITRDGLVFNPKDKIIKPTISNTGYLRVHLTSKTGKQKHYSVHRLVAILYVENPDPENKNQVNHKDGDKLNNDMDNLEWVTQSENMQHAYETGLCSIRGEKSHLSKSLYSDEIIHAIAKLLEQKMTTYDIIVALSLVEEPIERSSKIYQKWRRYIKGLRHRDCRNYILKNYNF